MDRDKRLEMFLNELKLLRDKYNLEIHGCGCCDCIMDVETGYDIVKKLDFDKETNKYWVEKSY